VTRIVAGRHGGRRLVVPPGVATRPTSDRVREALFSTLESMTELAGSRFADLYAGSGAVGLEAASRGAAAVLLVESDARAARTVRTNIATLGLAGTCVLSTAKVSTILATPPATPYDVVFADPPYSVAEAEISALLAALVPWLAQDGIAVLERSTRSAEPSTVDTLPLDRTKRYGETVLHYFRRADSGQK
jgi:16S rRNA (guanine(966)-N(2))-methyltransferase RsmD